mgnify:FL=1
MTCPGVVFVELPVQTSQGSMIGAMLGSPIKPFLVRTLVGSTGPIVKLSVPRMIANVPVIVVVREARRARDNQREHGRC